MSPDGLKAVQAVVKEVTRGLAGMMSHGQMRDSIRGWTRGILPPHFYFFKTLHLSAFNQIL